MNIPLLDTRTGVRSEFLGLGLKPWICLCYGNQLYSEDAAKVFGAVGIPPIFTEEQRRAWRAEGSGLDSAQTGAAASSPLLADPLSGTVEPLPEKCVERLAPGVLKLTHIPLRDTPLFLLDGTPW